MGVIKAGHTGYASASVAAENILRLITPSRSPPDDNANSLVEYARTPPQIHVTLGLVRCFDLALSGAPD